MGAVEICLVGLVVVIVSILWLRLHAFLGLILGAFAVALLTPGGGAEAMGKVAEGFGTGCRKIGILIAMAAIIGQCLLVSGAAKRIVQGILGLFGVKRAPMAFLGSGFVLGIPVFFDNVTKDLPRPWYNTALVIGPDGKKQYRQAKLFPC
ncbi:MAG: hypothetical protein ACON38_13600, partial [Akkermansiaceae bacterium]